MSPVSTMSGTSYTSEFFLNLVPSFDEVVFPVNPIILPSDIVLAIENMHASPEDAALVYAFGALTINLTQTTWGLHNDVISRISDLMNLSFRAHREVEIADLTSKLPVSLKRAMTCIFLEICFMAFKRYDRAFASLREAIAMIQVLEVDQCLDDDRLSNNEKSKRQRLYWEAFIHERFLTMMAGYPTILPPLRTGLPLTDTDINPRVNLGFDRLISLFSVMDDTFMSHVRVQHDKGHIAPKMTVAWIESKQAQLDQDERSSAEAEQSMRENNRESLSELQLADLFITRLWLRTLVWQLALSQGLLRSIPTQDSHEGFSMHFPAQRLSSELRSLVGRIDRVESIGIHGSGILQKLFEITSTVADVLALPIDHAHQETAARMDDFLFLVKFLLSFERMPGEQRAYLKDKIHTLQKEHAEIGFHNLDAYRLDLSPNAQRI